MTPYQLNILLDVYVGTPIRANPIAPAFEGTIEDMLAAGWIKPSDTPGYRFAATDKLRAFLDHVLALPAPVCKWGMP